MVVNQAARSTTWRRVTNGGGYCCGGSDNATVSLHVITKQSSARRSDVDFVTLVHCLDAVMFVICLESPHNS